ncbi:MAG: hypothetical protein E4H14_09805 [Candidatus Thorarchaeota archaeon]|nr:MAG: hypothetical protein E4H14_09805 [Candidatus Thorarchaeota archaeon]
MAAKDDNQAIKDIAEKVDDLAKDLEGIHNELKILGSISDIEEKTDAIDIMLKDIQSTISPVSQIDDIISSINEIKKFEEKLDSFATSEESEANTKKIDELSATLKGFEDDIQIIKESKETEVIIKKIDDILLSMPESDVLGKKLDDLQGYIAGLSGIEEKVEDLTAQFAETKEIVGIIVRQLDDIERKYNLSIEKLSDTADLVEKIAAESSAAEGFAKTTSKKPAKDYNEPEPVEKKLPISKAKLPSTIDALMSKLLDLVNPQTEAAFMAESLEEVRDELTPMISAHTPVLFQFGKKARELKSYPPTATLNENDIASLNKEIKSWAVKLKEIAKSS